MACTMGSTFLCFEENHWIVSFMVYAFYSKAFCQLSAYVHSYNALVSGKPRTPIPGECGALISKQFEWF